MDSIYAADFRLAFALSIHCLLFCSTFVLLYGEEGHKRRLEYVSLIVKRSYTGPPIGGAEGGGKLPWGLITHNASRS